MIRRLRGLWLPLLALLCWTVPSFAQDGAETAPESTGEPEAASAELAPATAPTRQEWVILMAILGEQLPNDSVLMGTTVEDNGDIVLRVAGATEEAVATALRPYFTKAIGSPSSDNLATVRLAGIPPSLGEYRTLKRDENGSAAPAAAAPTASATAAPSEPVWPPLRVRRVFDQNDIRRVQLTLDGRDYIVPEGGLFSNNAYRFVAMAPGADGQPSADCVTLERVATSDRRDLCSE